MVWGTSGINDHGMKWKMFDKKNFLLFISFLITLCLRLSSHSSCLTSHLMFPTKPNKIKMKENFKERWQREKKIWKLLLVTQFEHINIFRAFFVTNQIEIMNQWRRKEWPWVPWSRGSKLTKNFIEGCKFQYIMAVTLLKPGTN